MIGLRLKQLRKGRKLSQEALAKTLNVSQSTIAYYENEAKQPSYDVLDQIASLFNVSVDYLLGRTDNPVSYTETEKQIMNEKDLTPEALTEKYNLLIDGKKAGTEEIEEAIRYIKALRLIKKGVD